MRAKVGERFTIKADGDSWAVLDTLDGRVLAYFKFMWNAHRMAGKANRDAARPPPTPENER